MIDVFVRRVGLLGRASGLMFRSSKIGNLLFEFSSEKRRAIHSLFVFFPFLAVWLDSKNRVLDWGIVKPFRFRVVPSMRFRKLIEIPLSKKNRKVVNIVVGKNWERFK